MAGKTARNRKVAKRSRSAARETGPTTNAQARIARVAKGKKPQYFADPATDKLLWITITLMQELSVTRDRLDSVEKLLEQKKLLASGEVEAFAPVGQAAEQRSARRAAFIDRVMRPVQAELEGMAAAATAEDAVAAVSA